MLIAKIAFKIATRNCNYYMTEWLVIGPDSVLEFV